MTKDKKEQNTKTVSKDVVHTHRLLIIGIALIVIGAIVIGVANSKLSGCDSLGGKLMQTFDSESRAGCSYSKTALYLGFAPVVLGLSFVIINFTRKR